MKKLKTWVILGLLAIATLLSIPNNALAQTSGNYVTKDQRSGQFTVPANLEAGVTLTKGLPEIKLSQFMDSTRLLLPLLPWEFDIFLVGSPLEGF